MLAGILQEIMGMESTAERFPKRKQNKRNAGNLKDYTVPNLKTMKCMLCVAVSV